MLNKHESIFLFQQRDQLERYVPRYLVFALLWSFSGDSKLKSREELGSYIRSITTVPLPPGTKMPIVDYEVLCSLSCVAAICRA